MSVEKINDFCFVKRIPICAKGGFRLRLGCLKLIQRMLLLLLLLGISFHFGVADESVRRDATVKAVEKVMPSVVNIRTEILVERRDFYYDLLWEYFGPYYRRRPAESTYSLGSGVIIHKSGYVLTNAHVINRANRVEVILQDGTRYDAVPIAGMRSSDVALLKIQDEKSLPNFEPIGFASDDDLLLGETVLALGNPFGLGSSVSRGILSSKNRRPPMEDEPLEIEDWLQTDAAINPGNSGGPLINLAGEMIGLNVAVFKEGQGIGFAIPVKRVNDAIAEIMTPEVLRGLWFGAKVAGGKVPLAIAHVTESSPASEAGLREGDVILRINGARMGHIIDFYERLTESKGREPVDLEVKRSGDLVRLKVQLQPESDFFNAKLIAEKTGLTLQVITSQLARHLNLDSTQGAIVADVEEGSPAEKSGIRTGFIIMQIDQHRTDDLVSLAKHLHGVKSGQSVRIDLVVQRQVGRFLTLNRASASLKLR
jgi:serine protease Do